MSSPLVRSLRQSGVLAVVISSRALPATDLIPRGSIVSSHRDVLIVVHVQVDVNEAGEFKLGR